MNIQDLNRLSIPIADLRTLREENKIYVDKTDMVADLASYDNAFFLSRPRRFGKSLLLSTFAELFQNGLKSFSGLYAEKKWSDVKIYPVIFLTFSSYTRENIRIFKNDFSIDLKMQFYHAFPDLRNLAIPQDLPPNLLLAFFLKNISGKKVVVLIDEYDTPITHTMDRKEFQYAIIQNLASFFTVLKQYSYKCRFIFITGITKIAHLSLFSDVNFITDITFDDRYASIVGISEKECIQYYDAYVSNAAQELGMSVSTVYRSLQSNYDGYCFSPNAVDTVYAPWSLLSFLRAPSLGFRNYWYESGGTPTILINYLKDVQNSYPDKINSREQIEEISIDNLILKSNLDNIPINILLLQTGYFTIKKIDLFTLGLCLPNKEVSDSLFLLNMYIQKRALTIDTKNRIMNIPYMIDKECFQDIVELFSAILIECVSPKSNIFENEISIRDIIYLMIPEKLLRKSRENPNAFGYSDLELSTESTTLCIEFKRSYPGKTDIRALNEGIKQCHERKYALGSHRVCHIVMVVSTKKRLITTWKRVDTIDLC